MKNFYQLKISIIRLLFFLLTTICFVLYGYGLTDYIILLVLIMLFCGIFSISSIKLNNRQIEIRKNYFWTLIGLNRVILYEQVISIHNKHYDFEIHDEVLQSESFFIPSQVKWLTTKITYEQTGVRKDLELKMSKEDFRRIENRIIGNNPPSF
jgi:hypothetical protein